MFLQLFFLNSVGSYKIHFTGIKEQNSLQRLYILLSAKDNFIWIVNAYLAFGVFENEQGIVDSEDIGFRLNI